MKTQLSKSLITFFSVLSIGLPGLSYAGNNLKNQRKVERLMDQMSLDEKIGQLLLVGFRGMTPSRDIERAIKDYHVGSIIYFDYDVETKTRDRNISSPAQLKKLSAELQSLSKIPLFISVDEEGGKVSRLKSRYGFESKPSPESLGHKDLKIVTNSASKLARELRGVGINVNFAPLADVNVNPHNPVIGSLGRSFSSDPHKVERYCEAFIKGQASQNIVSVIKHFPGHGSSDADSHEGLVDVSESWSKAELIPFAGLIQKDSVDLIMSAHIFNRHLDADYPATLSKKTIGGILRGELGYEGVVISDDMNMGAIADHFGLEEAIFLALDAGIDILLFGNNLIYDQDIAAKAHGIIKDLVVKGRLSVERIDQSVSRILSLKAKSKLF